MGKEVKSLFANYFQSSQVGFSLSATCIVHPQLFLFLLKFFLFLMKSILTQLNNFKRTKSFFQWMERNGAIWHALQYNSCWPIYMNFLYLRQQAECGCFHLDLSQLCVCLRRKSRLLSSQFGRRQDKAFGDVCPHRSPSSLFRTIYNLKPQRQSPLPYSFHTLHKHEGMFF